MRAQDVGGIGDARSAASVRGRGAAQLGYGLLCWDARRSKGSGWACWAMKKKGGAAALLALLSRPKALHARRKREACCVQRMEAAQWCE